jgi:hypothetical protein
MTRLETPHWEPPRAVPEPPQAQHSYFASLWDNVQNAVANNPKVTIGIGLTVGVILGWLIKRRG